MPARRPAPRTRYRPRWSIPPLSRAGAVAVELDVGPAAPPAPLPVRAALLLLGALTLASGVGLTLWTGLGPGPLDAFIVAMVATLDLSFAVVVWSITVVLVLVAVSLGGRPGPGTVLAPLLVGPALDVTTRVLATVPSPGGAAAVGVHLLGILIIGLGAGALISSGLGAGTGELVAAAASRSTGRSEPLVRCGIELGFLALAVVLGGPIGVGTLIVALAIGPAVRLGHRTSSGLLARAFGPGAIGTPAVGGRP